ncbi:LRR receptor-like serine threonine-protein kinase [Seminavis robusta]|uniref:LRR receptor-like serine threonine-protein kinase n=1 Tax=Seminavis robusta TaxID=568900 RepID=A0A9N8ERV6_9STRA|nr:LRR receptor-like serine threonine-protein kinase [Seminavis robusta]|eukprot:Sro1480_g276140.1 LRR receptor-like serine threonine-protein kinase (792) ;mRNA; f:4980-7787
MKEEEAGKPGNLGSPYIEEQEHEEGQQEQEQEGLDPLDLAINVEARLTDSDASAIPVSQQQHTLDFFETEKSPHPPQKDSEATPTSNQQHTLDFLETEKSPHPHKIGAVLAKGPQPDLAKKKAEYREENVAMVELARIMEARLQDSGLYQGENITTPEHDDTRIELVDAPEDTVQNDDNLGIMPLPPLERTSVNRRAQVQPGAYPGGGNFQGTEEDLETTEIHIEPATTGPPMIEPEIDTSGLAVANLVQDETTAQDLPQAQDYSPDNINREERMKQFKTRVLLGVIVLLAIIMISVAILIPQSQGDLFPTTSPISTILENPGSPQSRAFKWLMEEIDILRNLTEQRVVQRFVLATFYFAVSKDQWFSSDNWLNHSVHECLWYSSLEDYYYYFEANTNIYMPLDHISPCEHEPTGYLQDGILYQGDGILKHFWLSYNGLVGSEIPPELYLLTDLKSLALDELNLTSTIPEELSGLSNLEYLSMLGCGLFGSIPEAIGRLSKLGNILVGLNSLTGTIPSSLYSLTSSMRCIIVTENQLTGPIPTELGLLTNLRGLLLDTNLFTGTIPTELGRLTLLESVLLHILMLSGTIPNEVVLLSDMKHLELDDSGITGTIPGWFGNMTSMEGLTIAFNSFTGTIPTELGLLTKMLVLWLNSNALSGTIPSELGMYKQAFVLNLHTNKLTGTIPTELGLLTELVQLKLENNSLTGTVPLELGNVSFPAPYGEVYLHGNDLSGIIPESLCSAHDLVFDCSTLLCGCGSCNCSDFETLLILQGEPTNEDGQLLSGTNQTEP